MFGDRNEQDAEECLQALLQMMSIELKEAKKVKDRKSLILDKNVKGETSSIPLNLPFEGWCSSTITCLKCHKARPKKHQTFVDISLSLQHLSRSRAQPDLLECLDHFSFQESLSNVECLNCSYTEMTKDKETFQEIFQRCGSKDIGDIIEKINFLEENSHQLDKVADEIGDCIEKVRTDASKQLKISRLPEVLCLHLSRRFFNPQTGKLLICTSLFMVLLFCKFFLIYFASFFNVDHVTLGNMTKNRFKISFPTHLDMKPYVESDVSSGSASSLILGSKHPPSNSEYNLRAVIVHHGDANTGQ